MKSNDRRFDTIREDLHRGYGHRFTAEQIDHKLDGVIERHSTRAVLDEFVPVLVERDVTEFFGEHRLHVRFAAGDDPALAKAAVALTKQYAGDALVVDSAVEPAEDLGDSHVAHVLQERGLYSASRHLDNVRTVAMPDFIVFLGADVPRDEAGKDVKIWDISRANTVEETRELLDDLEARVLYMLNKLGIEPVEAHEPVSA